MHLRPILPLSLFPLLALLTGPLLSPTVAGAQSFDSFELTLVDSTRRTDHWDPQYDAPARTLETLIRLPRTEGPAPLVIYAHGFNGTPENLPAMLDAWADAGYVVAAPFFPLTNREFSGPKNFADYPQETHDISFVITELLAASASGEGPLAGRIDGEHIAVTASSFGSIVVFGFYNTWGLDRRIDAILEIAGAPLPFPGLYVWWAGPPLMVVHSTTDELVPYAVGEWVYARKRGPKAFLTLNGATHVSAHQDPTTPQFPVVRDAAIAWFDLMLLGDAGAIARLEAAAAVPGVASLRHNGLTN